MKTTYCLFLASYFLFLVSSVTAQNMNSENYEIKNTNLNMTSGEKSSPNYKVKDTVGENSATSFSSTNSTVKTGFQNTYTTLPFTFSISKTSINFSNLEPLNPKTEELTLIVSPGEAHGFNVSVSEDSYLRKNESVHIPDLTACGKQDSQCSSIGFGYSMDEAYFQPFPNEAENEAPVTIMESSVPGNKKTAEMTLKVNIDKDQEAGQYQNTLNFIAIPNY